MTWVLTDDTAMETTGKGRIANSTKGTGTLERSSANHGDCLQNAVHTRGASGIHGKRNRNPFRGRRVKVADGALVSVALG